MNIDYKSSNTNVNSILYEAQLIANAFSKALEDNNCLLILPVGLHQEISTNIQDLEDLIDLVDEVNNGLDGITNEGNQASVLDTSDSIINDAKNRCLNCKLELPGVDFEIDLKGALNKLKAQIDLYKSLFELNKLDTCQVSYSLMNNCLPDILKLIVLLLTAYVSIMTLKKMSNLSVMAFIKGVLSTLLSKILGSLKISVNIGSTNVACLINALKEIALSLPTQEAINARLDYESKLGLGLVDFNNQNTNSDILRSKMVDDLYANINNNAEILSNAEGKLEDSNKTINESFELVSNVVDSAVSEVNEYVQSLLSFQTYFECETTRSGMDVEDAINTINKLITVINLLSAIALSIAKKEVRDNACKTKDHINSLSNNEINDLQLKDIIEEYNQKATELINSNENGLGLLIKEDPVEDGLPKIDLFNCSIDDFVEAHTLPNIIRVARKQVERERKKTTYTPEKINYIFRKPSGSQLDYINNLVDLIYVPPEESIPNESPVIIVPEIKNPIGNSDSVSQALQDILLNAEDKTKTSSLKCRSIDDVLSVLNTMKR